MGSDASDLARWDVHFRLSDVVRYLAQEAPGSLAHTDTARVLHLLSSEELREVWAAVEDEWRNDGYSGQVSDAARAYEDSVIIRAEAAWEETAGE